MLIHLRKRVYALGSSNERSYLPQDKCLGIILEAAFRAQEYVQSGLLFSVSNNRTVESHRGMTKASKRASSV